MTEERLVAGQAVVGTVPTLIAPYNAQRTTITLANNGDGNIYLGAEDVTPETGYILQVGQTVTIAGPQAFHGVTREGCETASFLERLP